MKQIISLMALFFSMTALGCQQEYEKISGKALQQKMTARAVNTMDSWWVVDNKGDFYCLEDRAGFKKYYYMVSKKEVLIDTDPQAQLPINLKIWNVKLLPE